jgi:hypothetical protein
MVTKQTIRSSIDIDGIQFEETYTIAQTNYALIFDTETHTNISQRARLGIYALINYVDNDIENARYYDRGMVSYDLSEQEDVLLQEYCLKKNIRYVTRNDFVDKILYNSVSRGIMLVGHNIVFDIGAIASHFAVDFEHDLFRFKCCYCNEGEEKNYGEILKPCEKHPCIVIKRVKTRKYIMYFEQDYFAPIVDTITLGNALLGAGASSLNAMVGRYGIEEEGKKEIENYEIYNEQFYEYAMHDVTLTSKLLISEYQLYKRHDLPKPFHTLMSEASVGKAYNEKLGILPFKLMHPEVPVVFYNTAIKAYYGGRSETYTRKIPTLVSYVDFKSQYPLINALLHLQDYLLAKYLRTEKCLNEVKEFFEKLIFNDLRYKETWLKLPILVRVKTNDDLLPYRTDKNQFELREQSNSILWFSLCDVIASYLMTGKKA